MNTGKKSHKAWKRYLFLSCVVQWGVVWCGGLFAQCSYHLCSNSAHEPNLCVPPNKIEVREMRRIPRKKKSLKKGRIYLGCSCVGAVSGFVRSRHPWLRLCVVIGHFNAATAVFRPSSSWDAVPHLDVAVISTIWPWLQVIVLWCCLRYLLAPCLLSCCWEYISGA